MQRPGTRIATLAFVFPVLSLALAWDGGQGATFSEFTVEWFEHQIEDPPGRGPGLVMAGHFGLGGRSDGLDLLSEEMVILLGRTVLTIPAGSLRLVGASYSWSGVIDGEPVGVAIDDHGGGAYSFAIAARCLDPVEAERIPVILVVGNDGGKELVRLDGVDRIAGGSEEWRRIEPR